MTKTLFINANEILTNEGVVKKSGKNINKNDLSIIKNGALLWDSRHGVLWLGNTSELTPNLKKNAQVVSLKNKILTPALIDCHTHTVFAGDRHNELALRLEGATYQEIAEQGGGIVSTVTQTNQATEKDLFQTAQKRISTMMAYGVGILEIKSGYGLSHDAEIKILKIIQKLKIKFKKQLKIQSTYLGAHAYPASCHSTESKKLYVESIINDSLPYISKKKLADACDVFFDQGYFDYDSSKKILLKAKSLNLKIKLHADELVNTGGASLAAELGALSADHLLKADETGIKAMAQKNVTAVLLPATALYLKMAYADFNKFKKNQVRVALATDFNPGSAPTQSLPLVMTLGCLAMNMSISETWAAVTHNAAWALGLEKSEGFIRKEGKASMAVFDVASLVSLIADMAATPKCLQIIRCQSR